MNKLEKLYLYSEYLYILSCCSNGRRYRRVQVLRPFAADKKQLLEKHVWALVSSKFALLGFGFTELFLPW